MAINYTGTANRSELSYNGLNRLVKVVEKNGNVINSTNKFIWCGTRRCEIRNANDGVSLRMYAQGQFDSGTAYFYSRDHLGSVHEMFKSDGTLIARYDYDPWGRSTAILNTIKPDANFTGLYRHAKSDLDFATFHAYDPDLGRWLSRDPVGEKKRKNGVASKHLTFCITRTCAFSLDSPAPDSRLRVSLGGFLQRTCRMTA